MLSSGCCRSRCRASPSRPCCAVCVSLSPIKGLFQSFPPGCCDAAAAHPTSLLAQSRRASRQRDGCAFRPDRASELGCCCHRCCGATSEKRVWIWVGSARPSRMERTVGRRSRVAFRAAIALGRFLSRANLNEMKAQLNRCHLRK